MVRVLIVDDSPPLRRQLVDMLAVDAGIEVVGCAADAEDAVRMTQEARPQVVAIDLHLPDCVGLAATRSIMQACPTPIVVVSGSASSKEIDAGIHAMEAGALTIVQRPGYPGPPAFADAANALIRAVKAMAEVKVVRRWAQSASPRPCVRPHERLRPRLVAIGASTGGPAALRDILAELGPDYALPVVIVQHMATGFMNGFAKWLAQASGFTVRVAAHGQQLEGRCAYLAPDGLQMSITRDLRIALGPAAPEHGMCPSVSHLFRSIDPEHRRNTVAVLLTGMGKDGARELRQLKDDGAVTFVQDRASAAVYGMPGEALAQDAAKHVLPPPEIGRALALIGRNGAGYLL